jgi:DNA-binding NtrC family response regulator
MKKSIAVVDDKPYIRDSLRITLSERLPDFEINTYSGGPDILSAIALGKRFDLIFMDGKLTDGYTGPMYTAVILEKCPETVVVGFSTDPELDQQFIDSGARLFLTKSLSLHELEEIIKKLLNV